MAISRAPLSLLCLCLLLPLALSLKFDIAAHTGHSNRYERCIRNFVQRETLVVVTAIVDGTKGDGQVVTMHVRPPDPPLRPRRSLSAE